MEHLKRPQEAGCEAAGSQESQDDRGEARDEVLRPLTSRRIDMSRLKGALYGGLILGAIGFVGGILGAIFGPSFGRRASGR
jgi:hypothetical protein